MRTPSHGRLRHVGELGVGDGVVGDAACTVTVRNGGVGAVRVRCQRVLYVRMAGCRVAEVRMHDSRVGAVRVRNGGVGAVCVADSRVGAVRVCWRGVGAVCVRNGRVAAVRVHGWREAAAVRAVQQVGVKMCGASVVEYERAGAGNFQRNAVADFDPLHDIAAADRRVGGKDACRHFRRYERGNLRNRQIGWRSSAST